MKKRNKMDKAKTHEELLEMMSETIFETVMDDLFGRKGLGDEWNQIDEEIKEEIRETNIKNIYEVLVANGF